MTVRPFPQDANLFAHTSRIELCLRRPGYHLRFGRPGRRRYMQALCRLYGHQANRGATFCIYCFGELTASSEKCGDLNAGLVAECIRSKGHDGDHQGIARGSRGLHSWT